MFDSCLRLSLLTACLLLPVSAAFVSRNLRDRRVSTYRDLGCSLSGLFSVACDETTTPASVRPSVCPYVPSLPRAPRRIEVLRQRRVFTSLRSHNSGRQTGKPFFLSLSFPFLLLVPCAFSFSSFFFADFPGSYTPPLFLQSP